MNLKILIVDDSSTMRRIIKNTCTRIGIKDLVLAEDGLEAISKLKEFGYDAFDIVLTDINMPNMNGYKLIEHIRRRNKFVPIVTISTEGGKGEIIRALKLGSTNYIVKPFTPQTLKEKLIKIIGIE